MYMTRMLGYPYETSTFAGETTRAPVLFSAMPVNTPFCSKLSETINRVKSLLKA